jgi:AcrR family transcriptional regulator
MVISRAVAENAAERSFPPLDDPQRGRRKLPRAVREQQMLDVAGRVFAKRGFHEASVEEIAQQAGISKPMIYNYFGSKEGLYFAYIELAGQRLLGRMADAARGADESREIDAEARLLASALAFFAHVDERREEWAVLFAELAARGGPFFQEVAAVRRIIIDRTAQLFDLVLVRAGISPDHVGGTEALACAFVGAGESLANWWLEHPEEPKEAMASRLIEVTWGGLKHLLGAGDPASSNEHGSHPGPEQPRRTTGPARAAR